jgi:RNA polymerase sigma-70 factor (ECF subfamily)
MDDQRTDQQLITAINAGDDHAFEALYYRYRDWVVRLAQRFTGNPDDVLDVLQETFAYLSRKFPGFD